MTVNTLASTPGWQETPQHDKRHKKGDLERNDELKCVYEVCDVVLRGGGAGARLCGGRRK